MSRNFFAGSFFSRGAVIMGQMGASIRKKQTGFLYLFRYTCNYSSLLTYAFSNILIEICFLFCLHISTVFRVCILIEICWFFFFYILTHIVFFTVLAGTMFGMVGTFSTSGLLCQYGFDNGWGSIFYITGYFVWSLFIFVLIIIYLYEQKTLI